MINNYTIYLKYKEEHNHYIGGVFELKGCIADGRTPEECLKNLEIVAKHWVDCAKEEGRVIPSRSKSYFNIW